MINSQIIEVQSEKREVGAYFDYAKIEKLTGRKEFFTNSATIQGNILSELFVKTNSMVTMESCLGHFGSELDKKRLRIPLLVIADIMLFAVEIGIKCLFPNVIPIPVQAKSLKAKIEDLMAPPATVETIVSNFTLKGDIVTAKAEARVNSRLYADANEFSFLLIPKNNFSRVKRNDVISDIPKELLKGYNEEKRLFYSCMTGLVEERAPFLNLGESIFLKSKTENSHGYKWRAISITHLKESDCYRSSLHNSALVTPVDYAKTMALTAELLVNYLSKKYFNFLSVPLAIKVREVNASSCLFLYPPVSLITIVDIDGQTIMKAQKSIKRGVNSFHANSMKVVVDDISNYLADIKDLSFFLIPKDSFLQ